MIRVALLVSLIFLSANGFAKTIVLANGEWPPYQAPSLKHNGYASHIVKEAFKLEGIQVEYKFFPWARALESTRKGKTAGTFLWGYNKEREKDFYYSDPILDVSYVFFYLKSKKFDWKSVDDLKGKKIAATIKYSYGKDFDTARSTGIFHIDESKNDETNFKKLLKGRVDLAPNDLDAGLDILKRNHKEKANLVAYHQKPLRNTPHYLLISKRQEDALSLVKAFNRGLKKLKASGKFKQFVESSRRGEYVK